MQETLLNSAIGQTVSCSKTVGESDIYLFAGITGDFSPNHVNEAEMAGTQYGQRIAHGALLVGYMSRASTLITAEVPELVRNYYPVSLGYDRIRFLAGVMIGDTVTVAYTVRTVDHLKMRTIAEVTLHKQTGQLCAVATHIMQWIAKT
jgi:acyl dehydratase